MEITRRVELPTDGNPGALTYTVSGDVRVSAKEKIATDPLPTNQFDAAILAQNRLEIGSARVAVSAHYALNADAEVTESAGGRPAPEYDGIGGYNLGNPDKISVETSAEWRVQGLTDLSRGDTNRTTARFEITDVGNSGKALGMLASGDVSGAASAAGVEMSTSFQQVERSGFALQSGFKLKVLEGNQVEATVILEAGVDDVISSQQSTTAPGATEPTGESDQTPAATTPPVDDGKTLVVTPREGVNLRDAPFGKGTTVIQHGTFLQQTGEPIASVDGSQWIPVSGTDVNDQPVNGYVYGGFVKPHDSSQGAMDGTGRTNPTLEYQRHDEVTVRQGDNLWDIAKQNGVSYEDLMALNKDHLISPELIFAGDTVYLPGTAKGPVESQTETQPTTESTETQPSTESTAPAQSPDQVPPASTPESENQESGRSTDEILKQYQVADDEVLKEAWSLSTFGGLMEFGSLRGITKTEADLMQQLYDSQPSFIHGADAILTFKSIVDSDGTDKEVNAYRVADQYYPPTDDKGMPIPGVNDGHNDAFRHAFYNAMLTKEFGVEFAAAFGTAHEGKPGNEADREAMDLYNNEVGRKIAEANPDATPKQLAELIYSAIERGEALVIDRHGELVFSNQEEVGRTGKADDAPVGGVMVPPKWNTES
jgi:nucleoid-associated protein YgaU